MGQMANLLTKRQQGSLPSNLEINPRGEGKEYYKAITLRSGYTRTPTNDSKRNKIVRRVGNRGRYRAKGWGLAPTKQFQWKAPKGSEMG